jgi:hypothetical protein
MHANIHVFTFKAGLLARVAHDLRLHVQRHAFILQAGKLRGHCDAASLEVEGAMTSHGLDRSALSEGDKRQILETVRTEILQSERHPRVEVEADVSADAAGTKFVVQGSLHLRGQARPLHLTLERRDDRLEGAFELTPSEFGIPPYKALAGAIKLQDRVRVQVELPLEGQDPAALLARTETLPL